MALTPHVVAHLGVRAVAYVRVSVEREGMISPELQMIAINDYCQRRGYHIVKALEDLDLSGRLWKTARSTPVSL